MVIAVSVFILRATHIVIAHEHVAIAVVAINAFSQLILLLLTMVHQTAMVIIISAILRLFAFFLIIFVHTTFSKLFVAHLQTQCYHQMITMCCYCMRFHCSIVNCSFRCTVVIATLIYIVVFCLTVKLTIATLSNQTSDVACEDRPIIRAVMQRTRKAISISVQYDEKKKKSGNVVCIYITKPSIVTQPSTHYHSSHLANFTRLFAHHVLFAIYCPLQHCCKERCMS